ncbi:MULTISPECIES: Cdc6/Cdc18 family protein [Halobaculum]|uniref:ORC1-type DNA replication protein n=2 Tax=Halobaculum TaxID=43927 RepID=A0A8T8WH56_9EURY|nr:MULTISPECIES: AAA family ATPase [Halobaculum]QZP39178.1 AAA family ATPase [Halobaculum magnesiiphilum]QZY04264.1 AAA family ATPase [Halobaculum roseum]
MTDSVSEGEFNTLGDYADEHGVATPQQRPERDDPLSVLDEEDPIFRDESILRIEHIPDAGKIVGRNRQIEAIAQRMKPAQQGNSGKGTIVLGKSGSGKTLVTRYVSREVQGRAADNDVRVGRAVVDCRQRRSETQAVIDIANQLNDPQATDISIPLKGIATGDYYDRLWRIVDELYDAIIIILDELDRLSPQEEMGSATRHQDADDSQLLYELSRAGEMENIDAGLTIFGISNDLKYGDRLDTRVESSFAPEEEVFPSYDANQLRDILEKRRDAFHDDVLTDDVIPLASAFSAQDHGDARRAIDFLRLAGEIARDTGADQVTENHVRAANDDTDVSRIQDLIDGTPTQVQIALTALAALSEVTNDNVTEFKAGEVHSVYKLFANDIDAEAHTQRYVTDLLREYDTMKLLSMERTGDGYASGNALWLELLDDPSLILRSVGAESRLRELRFDAEMRQAVLQRLSR